MVKVTPPVAASVVMKYGESADGLGKHATPTQTYWALVPRCQWMGT